MHDAESYLLVSGVSISMEVRCMGIQGMQDYVPSTGGVEQCECGRMEFLKWTENVSQAGQLK